jgi:hypothetical protein
MRANEIVAESAAVDLNEITRTRADDHPGNIERYQEPLKNLKPVPQNPDYYYHYDLFRGMDRLNLTGTDGQFTFYRKINNTTAEMIGYIKFRANNTDGLSQAIQVSNTAVDSEYRGRGVGLMMYGVVLGLGYTIVADESQTPQARRLWAKLAGMPGVTVRGLVEVPVQYTDPEQRIRYHPSTIEGIDGLLRGLRAEEIGHSGGRWTGYTIYHFPLRSQRGGAELGARGARLYTRDTGSDFDHDDDLFWGMYATMGQ